ncbi:hypothetical protein C8N32_105168 [Rhodovulum imhoffii]|uniref:PAS domain-containing protein n=1 Tax=Rhodovulum imhoffii TaxID=365340 RepID=A0A2T5BTN4_9RHOB|nr:PAS domain-containing protein [Rhodovulum imhoffii]MBK5934131.1 hypothetical protein [Rhodovulum imhoffii]PTN02795.1 hypothetical protein C8N32_105168 [Rhodovulum imhoffii]
MAHFPTLEEVDAYWHGLRKGRPLPRRAEIDPRGFQNALPGCFLLERISPHEARFRVAGSALADLMGMDLRGMPFSALVVPDDRIRMRRLLDGMFRTPSRMRVEIRAGGSHRGDGAMLVLPLSDSGGEISQALGVVAVSGRPGACVPQRLCLGRGQLLPLTTRPAPRPEEMSARPPAARRRPRLVLVHPTL